MKAKVKAKHIFAVLLCDFCADFILSKWSSDGGTVPIDASFDCFILNSLVQCIDIY